MSRLLHVVEHFQEVIVAGVALRSEWLRVLTPILIAGLCGAAASIVVGTERINILRAEVSNLQGKVARNTEIITRGDEKDAAMARDIVQILHAHELMQARIDDMRDVSAARCLQCHMTKVIDHSKRNAQPRRSTQPYP